MGIAPRSGVPLRGKPFEIFSRQRDLNPQSMVYDTIALPLSHVGTGAGYRPPSLKFRRPKRIGHRTIDKILLACPPKQDNHLERDTGIGPASQPWEGYILPLY